MRPERREATLGDWSLGTPVPRAITGCPSFLPLCALVVAVPTQRTRISRILRGLPIARGLAPAPKRGRGAACARRFAASMPHADHAPNGPAAWTRLTPVAPGRLVQRRRRLGPVDVRGTPRFGSVGRSRRAALAAQVRAATRSRPRQMPVVLAVAHAVAASVFLRLPR